MGVISCDRKGCDNTMSDYYVPGVGDICRECKREFISKHKHNPLIEGARGAEIALKEFMNTPKQEISESSFDFEAWFNEYDRYK